MHAAPPVELVLSGDWRERWVCALPWGLGVAAALAAASFRLADAEWHAWLVAVGALSGAVLGAWLARPMRGVLSWDGHLWRLSNPAAGTESVALHGVQVALDFGIGMVLTTDGQQWCIVTAGDAGPRWHGLRLALFNPTSPNVQVREHR